MVKEELKDKVLDKLSKINIQFKNIVNICVNKITEIISIDFLIKFRKLLFILLLYCCFVVNRYIFLLIVFFFMFKVSDLLFEITNKIFTDKNKSYLCLSIFCTFFIYISFRIHNMLLLFWSLSLIILAKNVNIILNIFSSVNRNFPQKLFLPLSIITISILFSLIFNYTAFNILIFNLCILIIVYLTDKYLSKYLLNNKNSSVITYLLYTNLIGLLFIILDLLGVIDI